MKIELDEIEISTLSIAINKIIDGNDSAIDELLTQKFKIIDKIVFAKYGFKSDLFRGFRKTQSYLTSSELGLKADIDQISSNIFSKDFESKYLSTIQDKLEIRYVGFRNRYKSYKIAEENLWTAYNEKYTQLGINDNVKYFIRSL